MICHHCGAQANEDAIFCTRCGSAFDGRMPHAHLHQPEQPGDEPPIYNWLVPAILATVCFCWPLGIVSIVYAAQVNGKQISGDIQGARDAAKNAKTWFFVAMGLGVLGIGLYLVSVVVVGLGGRH